MDDHNTILEQLSQLSQKALFLLDLSLVFLYNIVGIKSFFSDFVPPALSHTEIDTRFRSAVLTDRQTAYTLLLVYTWSFDRFQSYPKMQKRRLLNV